MNIFVLITTIIFVIILTIWLIYNFFWLNRPQTFLVYNSSGTITSDMTQGKNLATKLGGVLATVDQVNDELKNGASGCEYGYALCGSTGTCLNGFQPVFPLNTGYTGNVANCGMSPSLNFNLPGSQSAYGYWIYGSKPAVKTIDGWTIAPFHNSEGTDKTYIFNKYEIFGIPKVL